MTGRRRDRSPDRPVLAGVPATRGRHARGMGCNPMVNAHGYALLSFDQLTTASVLVGDRPPCACECESELRCVSLSVQQRKNVTTEQRPRVGDHRPGRGLAGALVAAPKPKAARRVAPLNLSIRDK